MRRRKYPRPDPALTFAAKTERVAKAFKESLSRLQELALNGKGKAKEYAADATSGKPKKHIIASAWALSEEVLHTTLGPLWWRCSMSEGDKKAKTARLKMVKTILAAVESQPFDYYDEWPPIEEFMHDFSASSHSIPQITGKDNAYEWDDKGFRFVFAAESEMQKGGPEARANAINRDLVKLCVIECPVKAVVYRGYSVKGKNAEKRKEVLDAIVRTISRCPSPGDTNEGWLLAGLVGEWPSGTSPYFHTLKVGDDEPQFHDW